MVFNEIIATPFEAEAFKRQLSPEIERLVPHQKAPSDA